MQYRTTVQISKGDLKKLMKPKAIKNFRQLAVIAGVDYPNLHNCVNNKVIMSEKTWNKIKVCL